MKKFLLVTFIGMVLAINVYGFVTDIIAAFDTAEDKEEFYTVIYVE